MDQEPQRAPHAPHDLLESLNHVEVTTAMSGASGAQHAALTDDVPLTLTIDQARAMFLARGRQVPSDRTMQGYCLDGKIFARKLHTSFRRTEYLINEPSLTEFIETKPIVATTAGAAHETKEPLNHVEVTTAMSGASGAADAELEEPVGEKRTIAQVLIENARLVAQLEGNAELIAEIRSDKQFLKQELSKRDDGGIKQLASEMLQTLQTMAGGRRLEAPSADIIHYKPVNDKDQGGGAAT